jgi:hypothetical protein
MNKHAWKQSAVCADYDTNLFFEKYEDDTLLRPAIDKLCSECPVRKECFAVGVSQKEWGIWGGIYIENGQISREFNNHRTKQSWGDTWKNLVMD